MRGRNPRLRWLAAVVALLALTIGIPAVLMLVAGWPFPRDVPDWDRIATALGQSDIPAGVVIKTLAVIVWIAWAQLVWALAWELVVNLRRTRTGHPARPTPAVPSIIAVGAARLIAVVLSIGLTVAATPRPALSRPQAVATVPAQRPVVAVAMSTRDTPTPAVASWTVTAHDTLWDIAERTLGDGSRAGEILELNPGVPSPRDLRVGQRLRLPDDAVIPAERAASPDPSSSNTMAPPAPMYVPDTVITVQRGENLWNLSAARLRTASADASPKAILDYLHDVVGANPTTIDNPNLIYPGERLLFPAIGTPPAATASTRPIPKDEQPVPPPESPATTPAEAASGNAAVRAPGHSTAAATSPPALPASSPSTDGSAVVAHDHGSAAPWPAVLAGATALASGIILTQRRLQNRAAATTARRLRPQPLGRTRQLERALVAASDIPLVRWANHELAVLATRLKPARATSSPVAIEVSATHGLELLWDAPSPSAPAPWEAFDGGWAWRLCYDPDLPVPATPNPAVMPGLVTLGERDGNTLLLDLEAFGSIAITGDPTRTEDLARSMITELAYGDDLANSYVHLLDVDLGSFDHSERVQRHQPDEALDLLRAVSHDHDRLLERHQLSSTFQLRLGGAAVGRELTVIAARTPLDGQSADVIVAAPPHRGVALILLGQAPGTGATIHVNDDGRAAVEPLGLTVQARQLPRSLAAGVADLLHDASQGAEQTMLDEEPPERRNGHRPTTPAVDTNAEHTNEMAIDSDADDEEKSPIPGLLVRVLGAPCIDEHTGLGRIELNLVTFLACNGGHATESQLIDAVWNGRAIERATLWNRISRARSILGPFVPAREQGSNLVRLTPGVITDAQILRSALECAQHVSAGQALDRLGTAMNLIRGVPFDAVGYDWAHEQQHYADACELVEQATLTIVDLAIDLDDVTAARRAISQGLKALRVNEPLYRARMRIEAHCGNHAGVRAAYDELVALLEELSDGDDSYAPSSTTTTLLNELLHSGRRTA
jgi:nucleoid-associated protein YgaU